MDSCGLRIHVIVALLDLHRGWIEHHVVGIAEISGTMRMATDWTRSNDRIVGEHLASNEQGSSDWDGWMHDSNTLQSLKKGSVFKIGVEDSHSE